MASHLRVSPFTVLVHYHLPKTLVGAECFREKGVAFLNDRNALSLGHLGVLFDVDPTSFRVCNEQGDSPSDLLSADAQDWSLFEVPTNQEVLHVTGRPLYLDTSTDSSLVLTDNMQALTSLLEDAPPPSSPPLRPLRRCSSCGAMTRSFLYLLFRVRRDERRFVCQKCIDATECALLYSHYHFYLTAPASHHEYVLDFPLMWPISPSFRSLFSPYYNETIIRCFEMYRSLPAVGVRGGEDGGFTWYTYGAIWARVCALATALRLLPEAVFTPQSAVCIAGPNSLNWIVVWLAVLHQAGVPVPLHSGLTIPQLQHILIVTSARLVIVDSSSADHIARGMCALAPMTLVVMDGSPADAALSQELASRYPQLQVIPLSTLETKGAEYELQYAPVRMAGSDLAAITFTSGSTGMPKGAPEAAHKSLRYLEYCFESEGAIPNVVVEYLPFTHGLARDNLLDCFVHGGRVALCTRSLAHLFEDTKEVCPTSFYGIPALWNTFYSDYQQALADALAAVDSQEFLDEKSKIRDRLEAQAKVRARFRALLGGRVQTIATGTAKISPIVLKALRQIFIGSRVDEYYGITEVGGVAANGFIYSDVGWKMIDVPELGYTTQDKPHPRGELLVQTDLMISEYYKDATNTSSNFSDGYFHTGDIVELLNADQGQIRIIDRRKYLVKLAHGEFVAPSELESLFAQSDLVSQVYVHGDLMKDYLVTVVVPDFEALQRHLGASASTLSHLQLCENMAAKSTIMREFRRFAEAEKLPAYEIPRAVALTTQRFTGECACFHILVRVLICNRNGLLTASFKNCRRNLAEHFADVIGAMFHAVESESNSLRDLIHKALDEQLVEGDAFGRQGLSSMDAVKLALALQKGQGGMSNVPVESLFGAKSLVDIQRVVEEAKAGLTHVTYLEMIINGPRNVKDVIVQVLADAQLPFSTGGCVIPSATPPYSRIFLTGATGFLGSEILRSLLENTTAQVVCLVRAKNDADASQRLARALSWWSTATLQIGERVLVVRGDLTNPDEREWEQIALECETIIHAAASVHWTAPYHALRKVNVLSTHHLLQLASAPPLMRPFLYVSTISAAIDKAAQVNPFSLLKQHVGQMDGYSASKAVSEQLVTEAGIHCGLPILIARPAFLSPSQVFPHENATDFLQRYLRGIVRVKACPTLNERCGLRVTPVNLVADALVAALAHPLHKGNKILLHADQPILFTKFHDALKNAGAELREEADYPQWLELIRQDGKENPLLPLLGHLQNKDFFHADMHNDGHVMVDDALIARYVSYLLPAKESSSM